MPATGFRFADASSDRSPIRSFWIRFDGLVFSSDNPIEVFLVTNWNLSGLEGSEFFWVGIGRFSDPIFDRDCLIIPFFYRIESVFRCFWLMMWRISIRLRCGLCISIRWPDLDVFDNKKSWDFYVKFSDFWSHGGNGCDLLVLESGAMAIQYFYDVKLWRRTDL